MADNIMFVTIFAHVIVMISESSDSWQGRRPAACGHDFQHFHVWTWTFYRSLTNFPNIGERSVLIVFAWNSKIWKYNKGQYKYMVSINNNTAVFPIAFCESQLVGFAVMEWMILWKKWWYFSVFVVRDGVISQWKWWYNYAD